VGPYDAEAIKQLVGDAIERGPRGTQAALARAADTKPQNVQRWARKMHAPDREYWAAIEAYFNWPEGRIAEVGGVRVVMGTASTTDVGIAATMIGEVVPNLIERRLAAIEAMLATHDDVLQRLLEDSPVGSLAVRGLQFDNPDAVLEAFEDAATELEEEASEGSARRHPRSEPDAS
jgi:hypothetical protein